VREAGLRTAREGEIRGKVVSVGKKAMAVGLEKGVGKETGEPKVSKAGRAA
jgi:hypothetical protein